MVSTPSDVSLQDARKAIEMFRQMKVDLVGMVENMSYFVCPHCNHQTDIFSRGGAEKTAATFGVAYLGEVQLDPEIRKASDSGRLLRGAARARCSNAQAASTMPISISHLNEHLDGLAAI